MIMSLINKQNPEMFANCGCCINPKRETIEHLFLKGEIVDKVQNKYFGVADIIDQKFNLKQSIRLRNNQERND